MSRKRSRAACFPRKNDDASMSYSSPCVCLVCEACRRACRRGRGNLRSGSLPTPMWRPDDALEYQWERHLVFAERCQRGDRHGEPFQQTPGHWRPVERYGRRCRYICLSRCKQSGIHVSHFSECSDLRIFNRLLSRRLQQHLPCYWCWTRVTGFPQCGVGPRGIYRQLRYPDPHRRGIGR